jgi:hypothetical protein
MDEICDFANSTVDRAGRRRAGPGASLKGKPMGTGIDRDLQLSGDQGPSLHRGWCGRYASRHERATMFGAYELPASFPRDSPYRAYQAPHRARRIHPLAAVIARAIAQDDHNAMVDGRFGT